jgi:hypothetical protein
VTLRLFLAFVFAAAALSKASVFREFEATLEASGLLPLSLVPPIAAAILGLELAVAVGLLGSMRVGSLHESSLQVSLILGSSFVAYSLWRWMQGISAPCNCFGRLLVLSPAQSMMLSMSVVGISAAALWMCHAGARGQEGLMTSTS